MTARPMRWSSTENGMDELVLEAFTPQEPGPGELSVEVGAAVRTQPVVAAVNAAGAVVTTAAVPTAVPAAAAILAVGRGHRDFRFIASRADDRRTDHSTQKLPPHAHFLPRGSKTQPVRQSGSDPRSPGRTPSGSSQNTLTGR